VTGAPPPRIGRALGVVVQVVAAIVVTVALLVAADFACGPLLKPDTGLAGDYVSEALSGLRRAPQALGSLAEDFDLLWRNRPLLDRQQPVNPLPFDHQDAAWTVQTNSEGFRGPERAFQGKRADLYRILCLGDSITFGFNVDQDAPFPRQLEAVLRRQYPGRQFEVIDAGVPGWSRAQGLRFLELQGLALQPDLVIIAHGTNDQFYAARITDREHLDARRGGRRVLGRLLAHTNLYRAAEALALWLRGESRDSPGCREQKRRTGSCHRVSLEEIAAYVRQARRLTSEAGSDLLALNLDFVGTEAVRGTHQAVDEDHIPFLDFVQRFVELERADEDARARQLALAPARAPATAPAGTPRRVLLRCLARQPGAAMSVEGDAYVTRGFPFESPLYDDGTHGDEMAGDRVFSVTLEVPPTVWGLEYMYRLDGAWEFTSMPPTRLAMGTRVLRVDRNEVGPVDVFSERLLMVERTHPDRHGHGVIAEEIAQKLERLPSFARFVQAPAAGH